MYIIYSSNDNGFCYLFTTTTARKHKKKTKYI